MAQLRPQLQKIIAKPDGLLTLAAVVVILTSLGQAVATVRELFASSKYVVQPLTMEYSATANVDAAHFTFTNLKEVPGYVCVKGTITNKSGKIVESVPVCTGELKPHSTISIQAPFQPGSVMVACGDEPDKYGNQHMNWDKCSFEMQDLSQKSR